jgi:hypothetical protein
MCAASNAGRTFPFVTAHCRPYASVTAIRNAPCPRRGVISVGAPKRACSWDANPGTLVVLHNVAVSSSRSHNSEPSTLSVEYRLPRWILGDHDFGTSNQRCEGKRLVVPEQSSRSLSREQRRYWLAIVLWSCANPQEKVRHCLGRTSPKRFESGGANDC